MSCHIRKSGEKDPGHRVDFAFTGDVDAGSVIQMTLNGVEIAMPMREWHALAVRAIGESTEQRDYWFTFNVAEDRPAMSALSDWAECHEHAKTFPMGGQCPDCASLKLCPDCGEPLLSNADGILQCTNCGWSEEDTVIQHIDGDPRNNDLENLKIVKSPR